MPAIPKKKKTKKLTLAQMRKKLDRLWFERIYERDKGVCQRCKRGDTLAGHHIFGKKAYPAGRWNLDNGVLLCYACHIYFAHAKPYDFEEWMKLYWRNQRFNPHVIGSGSDGEWFWDKTFFNVKETQQFRACDFESKKKELEEK